LGAYQDISDLNAFITFDMRRERQEEERGASWDKLRNTWNRRTPKKSKQFKVIYLLTFFFFASSSVKPRV